MRRNKELLPLRVKARLLVSDSGALIGACEAGAGIGKTLEIGCAQLLHNGRLVELFLERWDEHFPLYAIYPSRLHRAAKVRVFIEFWLEIMGKNQTEVHRKVR
jgi:DNA-binding transcriptional LysR family regulator